MVTSALALSMLQHDVYLKGAADAVTEYKTEENWKQGMIKKSQPFHNWDTILNIEFL